MAEKKINASAEKAEEAVKEVKAEVKAAAEKTSEAVKETAKKAVKTAEKAVKTAAKATKEKKETVKKAAAAVKADIKDEVIIQVSDRDEINVDAVIEAAKADYKAKGHRTPKAVTLYIKPEEGVAYYTVKGVGSEDQKVSL